jgi:hypothetical protein
MLSDLRSHVGQGAVAESMSLQYGAVVREFHQFCVAEKKVFPHFTESTLLEFVRSVFLEAGLWAYFVLCWQLWL